MLLAEPKTKPRFFGDRSFVARTPRLWNALPVDTGHEIAPNTVANATKIIVLATKIQKLVF